MGRPKKPIEVPGQEPETGAEQPTGAGNSLTATEIQTLNADGQRAEQEGQKFFHGRAPFLPILL